PDRLFLGAVGLEDGEELVDGQQVLDLLGQVQELQLAALAADGRIAADDLAQAGRVHVGDVGEVQDDLGLAAIHQPRHGIAEGVVPFADQDLPVEVEDGHVTDLALDDLHGAFSLRRQLLARSGHAITGLARLSTLGRGVLAFVPSPWICGSVCTPGPARRAATSPCPRAPSRARYRRRPSPPARAWPASPCSASPKRCRRGPGSWASSSPAWAWRPCRGKAGRWRPRSGPTSSASGTAASARKRRASTSPIR